MRILTNMQGYKGMPVFSHSGKKILFAQAVHIRDSMATRKPVVDIDLWELDIATGQLSFFAGPFHFYSAGFTSYFPDDQRILVDAIGEYYNNKNYKSNAVHIIRRGQMHLDPPLQFPGLENTSNGVLDRFGNMFFEAMINNEGFRILCVTPTQETKIMPYVPSTPRHEGVFSFSNVSVSPDGRYFAGVGIEGYPYRNESRIMMLDTKTNLWKQVILPQESKQINK